MKTKDTITLHAVWIPYMKAYRLYDPKHKEQTVAYVDAEDLEKEEQYGYTIVLEETAEDGNGEQGW